MAIQSSAMELKIERERVNVGFLIPTNLFNDMQSKASSYKLSNFCQIFRFLPAQIGMRKRKWKESANFRGETVAFRLMLCFLSSVLINIYSSIQLDFSFFSLPFFREPVFAPFAFCWWTTTDWGCNFHRVYVTRYRPQHNVECTILQCTNVYMMCLPERWLFTCSFFVVFASSRSHWNVSGLIWCVGVFGGVLEWKLRIEHIHAKICIPFSLTV